MILTRRRDVMGDLVNRWVTIVIASAVAVVIISLNGFLVSQFLFG